MKNKLSSCVVLTLVCMLILYAGMQNLRISLSPGNSEERFFNYMIILCTGIIFFSADIICVKKLGIRSEYSLPLMYIAAPVAAGFCFFNGLNGLIFVGTAVVIPAAAIHGLLALISFAVRKIGKEN